MIQRTPHRRELLRRQLDLIIYYGLLVTHGEQYNHLSRWEYMEETLAAERRYQRVDKRKKIGADGGGFPWKHIKTLPPSDFSIWENKGWPPSSGRHSQLKGWPSYHLQKGVLNPTTTDSRIYSAPLTQRMSRVQYYK